MSYIGGLLMQRIYHNNSTYNKESHQAGFTLIELMISLVLGLLISAAVIQVYIINTRTLTVQQSASEVQDSTIFALQSLEEHFRLANLGNPITSITSESDHGGIVLTPTNLGIVGTASNDLAKLLTISAGADSLSNTNTASDQLTIQYKNVTPNNMFDCEGGEIVTGSSEWVVERYFVRLATGANASATTKDLVLACDAGRVANTGGAVTDFGDAGEVIVPAIDQFQILLGVQTDVTQSTYISPTTYLTLTDKPPITTVKFGVVVRSTTPLITSTDNDRFQIFGIAQTLKTDTTRTKYYRRSYESTVLLRNARMMAVVATQPKLAAP